MKSISKFLLVIILLQLALSVEISNSNKQTQPTATNPLQYEVFTYYPEAQPKAIFQAGKFRFTVLTDRVIRVEEDKKEKFEDRASFAIVNRNLTVPAFTVKKGPIETTITTDKLQLSFNHVLKDLASIKVKGIGKDKLDFKGTWKHGEKDKGNLFGTIRTLDGYQPHTLDCSKIEESNKESQHCEYGVISKDGWVVINDQQNFMLGDDDWVVEQNKNEQDFYFFGHGLNYNQALKDFQLISGVQPVLPRYVLGVWWTRWFAYDDFSIKNVITNFKQYNLPMDVCVIDMNWHQKLAWGGYTFDSNLFPDSQYTLDWIHNQGPQVGLNIHDADGVHNYEEKFDDMCKAMGLDPKNTTQIQFQICSSKKYAFSLDDTILLPLEKQGVNFWWIDWQQDAKSGGCQGEKQNPTIQLNKLRSTSPKRRNPKGANKDVLRRIVQARFGGLGNHRYQVGFSGDVPKIDWPNLALQPYFSATAANVGFGYWSHDITGHGNDMQLYLRWVQWGAYSGIMRFHERGESAGGCANDVFPDPAGGFQNKKCWQWAPYDAPYKVIDAIRDILRNRVELVPYLYTGSRLTNEDGVSFLRPLYYDYPEEEMAYHCLTIDGKMSQYMYGTRMMIAPIVAPINTSFSYMVQKTVWVPPGQWIEQITGVMYTGPLNLTKLYDLYETPVFIKAGTIIPRRPTTNGYQMSTAQNDFTSLQFDIYPHGDVKTNFLQVYEDDGITNAYLDKFYSVVEANYTTDQATYLNVTFIDVKTPNVWKTSDERYFTVKIFSTYPPTTITYQTKSMATPKEIVYSQFVNDEGQWTYNSLDIAVVIKIPQIHDSDLPMVLSVQGQFSDNKKLLGIRGGVVKASQAKSNLDETHVTPAGYGVGDNNLIIATTYGERLAENADPKLFSQFNNLVNQFGTVFKNAYESIKNETGGERLKYSVDLLKSADLNVN